MNEIKTPLTLHAETIIEDAEGRYILSAGYSHAGMPESKKTAEAIAKETIAKLNSFHKLVEALEILADALDITTSKEKLRTINELKEIALKALAAVKGETGKTD